MDMRKFITLLLLTTSLAAAPRRLSPERPVGDPKPFDNMLAAGPIDIATGGDSILAAWSDPRSGTHRDIYATHLDDQGNALEPSGIPLDTSALDKQLIRLIADGDRYLALWKSGSIIAVTPMHGIAITLLDRA